MVISRFVASYPSQCALSQGHINCMSVYACSGTSTLSLLDSFYNLQNTSHCTIFDTEDEDGRILPNLSELDYRGLKKHSKKSSLSDFLLLKVIGRGAYGKVYLVKKRTGCDQNVYYAMKVVKKSDVSFHTKDKEHMQTERLILERVRHPFLVRLYYAFQSEEKLFLIMEYVPGGELFRHICKEKMLLQSEAKIHLAQVALALNHLHECNIIYRDLKPENILRDSEGFIKLTDFGMSKMRTNGNLKTKTFCGTMEFMAPEVIQELEYDNQVDWWSFGVLTFYIITGNVPFKAPNKKLLIDKIMKDKLIFPKYVSSEAQDLIRKCLKKNATERINFAKISRHPFFVGINWPSMEARNFVPPNKPFLNNSLEDVSNFDALFTEMVLESPPTKEAAQISPTKKELMKFDGFSYVSSSLYDSMQQND